MKKMISIRLDENLISEAQTFALEHETTLTKVIEKALRGKLLEEISWEINHLEDTITEIEREPYIECEEQIEGLTEEEIEKIIEAIKDHRAKSIEKIEREKIKKEMKLEEIRRALF